MQQTEMQSRIKEYIEQIEGVTVRHVHPCDRNEQGQPWTWWIDAVRGGVWQSGLFVPGIPGGEFPPLSKISAAFGVES